MKEVMLFNATLKTLKLYRDGQFYWWMKLENPEKTTDLVKVTDKLYHHSSCEKVS
jgi:hypothetical protein